MSELENDEVAVSSGTVPGRWRSKTTWIVGAILLAIALVGLWYGVAWLRAPGIRGEIPPVPNLTDASPLMAKAIHTADRAAHEGLPSAERIGLLATLYHANLFYSEADACYAVAANLAPKDDRWPYGRGLLAYDEGRLKQARTFFKQAAARRSDNPCVWLRLGDACLKLDRFDEAASAYRKTEAWAPYALHAHFGLARVAERQSDWAVVVKQLENDVKRHPDFGPSRRLLATAYTELGRPKEAESLLPPHVKLPASIAFDDPFERQLEQVSFSSTFLLQQATRAARQGRPRLEGDILQRLVQVAPDDPDAHVAFASWCRGAAMEARSRGLEEAAHPALEHAIGEATRAISLNPDIPRAYLVLGASLAMQKKPLQAVKALRKAVELDPRMAEAYRRLGVALVDLGKKAEAETCCRKAVTLAPDSSDAWDALGLVQARSGKWEEALKTWGRSVTVSPGSPMPRFNRIQALLKLGRREEAERELAELRKRMPDFALAGQLQRELGTAKNSAPVQPSSEPETEKR